MERIERDELGDLLFGILIEISGFAEVFSTLDDAVADGLDLVIGLDDVEFEKGLEDGRTVTNIYGSNYNYATAIVAPHSVDGHFVKVTYDSKEYYYDITKELLSGHTYKLNLMLKDKALVAIEGNEINGWTSLPHNTLTLSQEETEVVLGSSIAVTVSIK